MKIERQFYKIKDVAQIMGLSTKTIRRKIYSGKIKAIKNDGRTGEYLIHKSEIDKLIKSFDV